MKRNCKGDIIIMVFFKRFRTLRESRLSKRLYADALANDFLNMWVSIVGDG